MVIFSGRVKPKRIMSVTSITDFKKRTRNIRGKNKDKGIRTISKLEVIFCAFLADNNFVNALILFIRVTDVLLFSLCTISRKQRWQQCVTFHQQSGGLGLGFVIRSCSVTLPCSAPIDNKRDRF
jgi:hypothetical protein